MNISDNKVTDLKTAIGRYVEDGAHLSIGGFTVSRAPIAAVHEIVRQRRRRLHLYVHSSGQGVDELVGGGCLERLELAYAGNGRFAPTMNRFRKAVQRGEIAVEDYSNYQMTLRFMAGAMGVPFLPVRSTLGTDIVDEWGFSESFRKADPKIPNDKLKVVDNPFGDWQGASRLVLVPAINPDVTVLHVQKADAQGTARIEGLVYADVEQAKAAKHLIVTCEELVESDELRENPDRNSLPHFLVDAVVPVPFGAYPTACYRYYDYDPTFLSRHETLAKDDARYREYLDEYVLGVRDHQEFLQRIGKENLERIKADPRTGYATGLDRK
ncbi:MAG: CoA transferase subunit A [Proteobacteria bacterium]|nr:CoA transferase subunit A [Pseudomonadota bacterium]